MRFQPLRRPWIGAVVLAMLMLIPLAAESAAQARDGIQTTSERSSVRMSEPPSPSTSGVDLEVRVWRLRVGFPWLKYLPITPGRRIVIAIWSENVEYRM